MNFPFERPASIVKAWNILCEAVLERMIFYGVPESFITRRRFFPLPEIPCRRDVPDEIADMISEIRGSIVNLINSSWEEGNFGKWSTRQINLLNRTADEPRLSSCGIDPCAFWMVPEKVPSYRHSVSEFIKAASMAVNELVRYPLPMIGTGSPLMEGFEIDCTLQVCREKTGETETGQYSDTGPLFTVDGRGSVSSSDLAVWQKNEYRGRAYGHRWYYQRAMCSYSGNYFTMPQLRNQGAIRCRVKVRRENGAVVLDEMQEFIMDFDTGAAVSGLDFSAVSDLSHRIFSGSVADDPEYAGKSRVFLRLSWDQTAILLTEENFPELPYKYITIS